MFGKWSRNMRFSIPSMLNNYFPAFIVIVLWVPLAFYTRNSKIEFEVVYPTDKYPLFALVTPRHSQNDDDDSDPSQDANQKEQMPSRFDPGWWRERIQSHCDRLGLETTPELFMHNRVTPVILHDKLKIAYCPISEVQTRYSENIFSIIADYYTAKGIRQLEPRDVRVSNSRDFEDEDQEYFKFMFVSDPLTRLMLAFMNKFKSRDPAFARLGRKIVRTYRTDTMNRGHLSFQEFVEYLIDPKRRVPIFQYWQPFYQLCGVCRLRYDFVGTLETVDEDVRHILSANDLDDYVQLSKINSTAQPPTYQQARSSLEAFYSTVPKRSLIKLLRMYYYDYLLFNMTVPPIIEEVIRHKKLS